MERNPEAKILSHGEMGYQGFFDNKISRRKNINQRGKFNDKLVRLLVGLFAYGENCEFSKGQVIISRRNSPRNVSMENTLKQFLILIMLLLVVEKLGRQVFIENNIVSQQSIKNSVPSCSNGTRVECFYEITSGDNRSRVYS